jgi:hypothetical protein
VIRVARRAEIAYDTPRMSADARLTSLLDALEHALKEPDVGASLTDSGVNVSLALVATSGLRAYLAGHKDQAAEEFATAAEEIASRLRRSREHLS